MDQLPVSKRCSICKKVVAAEKFRLYRSGMNGSFYLDSYCKPCRGEYYRKWMRRRKWKREKVA